jgi:hypothetical protein
MNFPETQSKINIEIDNKEFYLQHFHYKYRCISWHPHYIMTAWVKSKDEAIADGDNAVKQYYDKLQ